MEAAGDKAYAAGKYAHAIKVVNNACQEKSDFRSKLVPNATPRAILDFIKQHHRSLIIDRSDAINIIKETMTSWRSAAPNVVNIVDVTPHDVIHVIQTRTALPPRDFELEVHFQLAFLVVLLCHPGVDIHTVEVELKVKKRKQTEPNGSLVGRVDVVYCDMGGHFYKVELKNNQKAYLQESNISNIGPDTQLTRQSFNFVPGALAHNHPCTVAQATKHVMTKQCRNYILHGASSWVCFWAGGYCHTISYLADVADPLALSACFASLLLI